jgi:hypothetical protein
MSIGQGEMRHNFRYICRKNKIFKGYSRHPQEPLKGGESHRFTDTLTLYVRAEAKKSVRNCQK